MDKIYLGIDCGSVSVKAVCINENNDIIAHIYLKNKGLIETIKEILKYMEIKIKDIDGVGVTGSGREFTKILIGADLIKTEILAHSIATLYYYPNVKTIFDIGGEDCKIMTLNDGILNNFIMNNICGAGTGATIDSITSRLGIKIEEAGDIALKSKNKLNFPGKCGIFAQSAVVSRLNTGADKSDILMGVCRGLINNFLTLAKNIKLLPPYVFQGATAKNKALIKALEDELKEKVIIPENCELMGAIGIAILVKEAKKEKTSFKGFNIINQDLKTKSLICTNCPNNCEISQIVEKDKILGSIGSRCGKY